MFQRTLLRRLHLFRRVEIHELGGPQHLQLKDYSATDLAAALGPDDVLVRNSFAGVNFIDTYYRTGLYKKPSGVPFVLGEEGSGAVVKVGANVCKSRLGERVAYFSGSSGSYSSFTVVKARDAFPVPQCVGDDAAAAVMLQGCTAHYLCRSVYPVRRGDVVLVHAAAGGTGLLLTQMCKALGATVIGTCGSAEKEAVATQFGSVDHIINYNVFPHTDDSQAPLSWVAKVRQLCPGGVSCVFDGVGQATFLSSLKVLRRRGTMITFGNASGPVAPVSPLLLSQHGSIALHRPTLKDYASHEKNEIEHRVADIFNQMETKELSVLIGKVFPLHKVRDAHEYLEERHSHGKLLLNCQE